MMILKNKKIVILGAGPVGLTMARLLQQKGVDVAVYERDKDSLSRIWGGTLDLHEHSGQRALKKAGLLEHYFARAIPMGRTLTDEQANPFFSKKPQQECPEINRNELRTLLLESLGPDTVVWDRRFTSLEAQDGQWLLHFENGPDVMADLVIVANGGMSNARTSVTDTRVANTGTCIIQGEVFQPQKTCPEFYSRCNDTILMTAYKGITLVANPKNNGALTYGVTFRRPDESNHDGGLNFQKPEEVAAFLSTMLSNWHTCYQELFRATSFFVELPARILPLNTPWKKDRPLPITLIGDAAHLMPPFAGEGLNTGLLDAFYLSENLTSGAFDTIDAAIIAYEQTMFGYAKEAQLESLQNELEMHHPNFSFQKRFNPS